MEMEDEQKVCLAGWRLTLGSILFRALVPSYQKQASAKIRQSAQRGNYSHCGSSLAAAESWPLFGTSLAESGRPRAGQLVVVVVVVL